MSEANRYQELKKKREAAEKARDKAIAVLTDTYEDYHAELVARNAALPSGLYVEVDSTSYTFYRKSAGDWGYYNGEQFEVPYFLYDSQEGDGEYEFDFDLEVVPVAEVKW